MIAACPRCSSRYRIESDRLRAEGVRLRCSRCDAVFRVRPPVGSAAPATPPEPPVAEASAPAPVEAPPTPAEPPAPAPTVPPAARTAEARQPQDTLPPADRQRLVLIADPEVEQGKITASALADWGLQPILVHDGVEAILSIQRMLPRVIVLDAALPKMFGFQVCELVKRNESLREIRVVLVGAIHAQDRYRRAPSELYGADTYLERHQLPDALRELLRGFGLPIGGGAAAARPPEPAPVPEPVDERPAQAPQPEPEPAVAPPAPEAPTAAVAPPVEQAAAPEPTPVAPPVQKSAPVASDEGVAQAERLARIVVSDIVLYNQEKFEAAVASGNVLEAMEPELAEGRALFAARIDATLREQRDFLAEELHRVARQRSER